MTLYRETSQGDQPKAYSITATLYYYIANLFLCLEYCTCRRFCKSKNTHTLGWWRHQIYSTFSLQSIFDSYFIPIWMMEQGFIQYPPAFFSLCSLLNKLDLWHKKVKGFLFTVTTTESVFSLAWHSISNSNQ